MPTPLGDFVPPTVHFSAPNGAKNVAEQLDKLKGPARSTPLSLSTGKGTWIAANQGAVGCLTQQHPQWRSPDPSWVLWCLWGGFGVPQPTFHP